MSDAPDLNAACLAHVRDPATSRRPESVPPHLVLVHAMRALVARLDTIVPPAPDDGIRLMDIRRCRAEPGDVIVAYAPGQLRPEDAEALAATLRLTFPGHQCLVSMGGIGLEVVNAKDAPIAKCPACDGVGRLRWRRDDGSTLVENCPDCRPAPVAP